MQIRRLRFRASGGFAGIVRGTEVEGHVLSASDLASLERWLTTATRPRAGAARDQVIYEWDVDTDAGVKHAECDELSVPDGLDDLVQRLLRQARPVAP